MKLVDDVLVRGIYEWKFIPFTEILDETRFRFMFYESLDSVLKML